MPKGEVVGRGENFIAGFTVTPLSTIQPGSKEVQNTGVSAEQPATAALIERGQQSPSASPTMLIGRGTRQAANKRVLTARVAGTRDTVDTATPGKPSEIGVDVVGRTENEKFVSERFKGSSSLFESIGDDVLCVYTQVFPSIIAAYQRQREGVVSDPDIDLRAKEKINRRTEEFVIAGKQRITEALQDPDTTFILLRDQKDKRIVGFTYYFPQDKTPERVEVGHTAILSDFRGQGGWSLMMDNLDSGIAQDGSFTSMVRVVRKEVADKVRNRYKDNIIDQDEKEIVDPRYGEQQILTIALNSSLPLYEESSTGNETHITDLSQRTFPGVTFKELKRGGELMIQTETTTYEDAEIEVTGIIVLDFGGEIKIEPWNEASVKKEFVTLLQRLDKQIRKPALTMDRKTLKLVTPTELHTKIFTENERESIADRYGQQMINEVGGTVIYHRDGSLTIYVTTLGEGEKITKEIMIFKTLHEFGHTIGEQLDHPVFEELKAMAFAKFGMRNYLNSDNWSEWTQLGESIVHDTAQFWLQQLLDQGITEEEILAHLTGRPFGDANPNDYLKHIIATDVVEEHSPALIS